MPHTNPPTLSALPMQLTLAMLSWASSSAALRNMNGAWQGWNPSWPNAAGMSGLDFAAMGMDGASIARLMEKLAPFVGLTKMADNPALTSAVESEARQRLIELLAGVRAYQNHPYRRRVEEPPVAWRKGSARLLDYGALEGPPITGPAILLVPSLINRYYILDLEPYCSFARFLREQGFHPLLLDWGEPGTAEKSFTSADYITRYLSDALTETVRLAQRKVILAGYCMGGVLALALAQLRQAEIAGLALLATPWDFFSADAARIALDTANIKKLTALIEESDTLSPEAIQMMFYSINPWVFHRKFRQFGKLRPESREAYAFMALEWWVNDGVALGREVARECLIGWAQYNEPVRGQWRVGGEAIDPRAIRVPTFIAAPKNDRIVPSGCALALAAEIPHRTLHEPRSGHVGMMIGTRARTELWEPFAGWGRGISGISGR